jgi:uncharacterized protein (TIGR03437 family)
MTGKFERHVRASGSFGAAFCVALGMAAVAPAAVQQYTISTIAGGGAATPLTMPTRGLDLSIGAVSNLAVDGAGNVYFVAGATILKLDPQGIVNRIAGTGRYGYSGDGGPATSAQLAGPVGLAADGAGNLFFVDAGRVRRIAPSGTISTVAGTGTDGYSVDGGPAVSAQLSSPYAIAVDGAGNLYIADTGKNIRKVSRNGIITTVAGNGTEGFSGDGGPATSAELLYPSSLAVDNAGNLYIADAGNLRIRKVTPGGIISTVAGDGESGYSGDGGPATDAKFTYPQTIAADSAGNLYIADCDYDSGNARIRMVSTSGIMSTVAGNGNPGFSGDGGLATSAQLNGSEAVAVDAAGDIFIADSYNGRLRKVSPDGIINTIAGSNELPSVSGDGGPAVRATLLNQPRSLTVDAAGNLFILENSIRKVSPDGIISTVASVGGNALAEDAAGNFYAGGLKIIKVSANGTVSTVTAAGATAAGVGAYGMAVDVAGNLFVGSGAALSKVSPGGAVSTVAGGGKDVPGDDGPATSALLNNVTGVALDGAGNLFFSETYGHRVRKVSPDGIITTVAGTGTAGVSGDGGPATSAQLNGPDGVALDAAGNLYIADVYNSRIRLVTPDGSINTIAGASASGPYGYSGDGGPAVNAQLNNPWSLAVDQQGNVYVADTFNQVVRVLKPAHSALLIGSVVDAASERASPVSPGKIVVIYGSGLGPAQLVQNQANNGQIGTQIGGTAVWFNGIAAPVLYASATQVAAIVPYAVTGASAQVAVSYQGQASAAFAVPVTASAPAIFTSNQTGAGQIAAFNAVDGTVNSATNPAKPGGYISLYATGEGQTSPAGQDGKVGPSVPPTPVLPVTVTVGGMPATVQYAGGVPGQIAGLMQINVQIPSGVQPGGYVPLILKVGEASTTPDAVWIAVSGN